MCQHCVGGCYASSMLLCHQWLEVTVYFLWLEKQHGASIIKKNVFVLASLSISVEVWCKWDCSCDCKGLDFWAVFDLAVLVLADLYSLQTYMSA